MRKLECPHCKKKVKVVIRTKPEEVRYPDDPSYEEGITLTARQRHVYCTECGNRIRCSEVEEGNIFLIWDELDRKGLWPFKSRVVDAASKEQGVNWLVHYTTSVDDESEFISQEHF